MLKLIKASPDFYDKVYYDGLGPNAIPQSDVREAHQEYIVAVIRKVNWNLFDAEFNATYYERNEFTKEEF